LILLTGGLGFIGSHTTRALLDLGESCVLVQRRPPTTPVGLANEMGRRLFIEQANLNDLATLLAIGRRHRVTGMIPAFKKIGELLGNYLGGLLDIEVLNLRIGTVWGPLGRAASPFFAAPQLVHAAVRGTLPDLSALYSPAYADDGIDLCYVRDCGRAIALLQLTQRLSHRT
jgi:nucleoside-diphosphate-sugar epimerase